MKTYLIYTLEVDLDWDINDRFIFVTLDKDKAEKYIEKANKLHKKWKDYYNNFDWENIQDWQRKRDDSISEILSFNYREIELR